MPWIDVCSLDDIDRRDLTRFDHDGRAFAVYQCKDGALYCSDGLCAHEHVRLAEGFVVDLEIECPRQKGLFDDCTGRPKRAPACIDLQGYVSRVEGGCVVLDMP